MGVKILFRLKNNITKTIIPHIKDSLNKIHKPIFFFLLQSLKNVFMDISK